MRTSEAPDGGHGLLDLPDAPHAPALHVDLEAEPPVLGFLLRRTKTILSGLMRAAESMNGSEKKKEVRLIPHRFHGFPVQSLPPEVIRLPGIWEEAEDGLNTPMCDQGRVSGKRVPLTANQPDWTAQSSMRCCEESDELDLHPVHISQCSNLFIREGGRNFFFLRH